MKFNVFINKNLTQQFYTYLIVVLASILMQGQARAFGDSNGIDPTLPLSGTSQMTAEKIKKQLVLESIFHGSKLHTVIISGKVMKVNDKIGEYKLVAVNDDSVVLRSPDKRIKLYVFSQKIIK